jgi:hypothetical protein
VLGHTTATALQVQSTPTAYLQAVGAGDHLAVPLLLPLLAICEAQQARAAAASLCVRAVLRVCGVG